MLIAARRKIYLSFSLVLLASTCTGVSYALLRDDAATGITLATYILTCLTLALGLLAAGEFIGLDKPDAFAFVYDLKNKEVVRAQYVDEIVRPVD